MRLVVWTSIVALGLVAGNLRAQTELPWDHIFEQLGSPDYAQRERGQKQLDAIPPTLIDLVRQRAATATDPEVQASLFNRVDAMEKYLALHPKPLSIDVNDATLSDVVDAINHSAGQKLVETPGAMGLLSPRYTLKADNLGFWQIYDKLDRQHAITVKASKETLAFQAGNEGTPTVVCDSLLIAPQCIAVPRAVVMNGRILQAGGGINLYVVGIADPRVQVLPTSNSLALIEARDDHGVDLTSGFNQANVQLTGSDAGPSMFAVLARLGEPDPQAKKIATLRAVVKLVVATRVETRVFDDAAKQFGTPIRCTGGTLTVRSQGMGAVASWRIEGPRKVGTAASIPTAIVTIKSSTGDIVSKSTASQDSSSSVNYGGPAAGPMTMEIIIPLETKEVLVPVELKDIPLPRVPPVQLIR